MRKNKLRQCLLLGTCIPVVLLMMTTAFAQSEDHGWSGRFWAGPSGRYVLQDNEPFSVPSLGTVGLHVQGSAPSVGGDMEYRLNRWFGIDAAAAYTRFNIQFTSSNAPDIALSQKLNVVPLFASLNVHIVQSRRADVWAGPQIGYLFFGNSMNYTVNSTTFNYRPANTFSMEGLVVGTDVYLRPSLAVNAAFRWQNGDADSNGNLTVDPTFATIGITKRF
jgi:Outer membrane protein beta-barrel domain